jgi:hypothetical protein
LLRKHYFVGEQEEENSEEMSGIHAQLWRHRVTSEHLRKIEIVTEFDTDTLQTEATVSESAEHAARIAHVEEMCLHSNTQPRGRVLCIMHAGHTETLTGTLTLNISSESQTQSKAPAAGSVSAKKQAHFIFQPNDPHFGSFLALRHEVPHAILSEPQTYSQQVFIGA